MGSTLVINAAGRETRVALVENGHIAEFYLERKKDKGIVGNIYKGRVTRVLPGMQAAFLDIGEEKAAFLYVGDVVYDPDFARAQFELTEGEHEETAEVPEVLEADLREPSTPVGEALQGAEAPSSGAPPAIEESAPTPAEVMEAGPEASPPVAEPMVNSAVTSEISPPVPLGAVDTPALESTPVEGAVLDAAAVTATSSGESPVESRGEKRAPREERGRDRKRNEERGRDRDRGRHHRQEEPKKSFKQTRIEDVLKVGQEVVVQISKDPIGTKGARLTSHISIPGRHLVFMPTVDHVGISRRISNEKERKRLRDTVDRMRPPGTGFIVRTVAENVPQEKLESDIRFLIEIWNQVVRRNEKRKGPGLIHPDLDLILRATRDLFAQDVEKLVVDDREEYERILGFIEAQDPALKSRVVLHDNEEPVFDAYGIEQEIQRATQRKVWLRSGGYLIIDQAEALTAVDVNSGRYVGKKSLEETITKINVEAAKEIVYQLRLRNIGGIIICDFIDMERPQNRDKVFKSLQEALGRDKAKTNVLRISELGLVEMTRKRVRESIGRVLHEDCSYCGGQGFVKTGTTICYEIFREIRREAPNFKDPTLVVNCSTEVGRILQAEERDELRHLMDRYNKSIQIKTHAHYHREQFDLYGRSAQGVDRKSQSSSPHPPEEGVEHAKPSESQREGREASGNP